MGSTEIIGAIVVSVAGMVAATAVCGAVAFILKTYRDLIESNASRSDRDDEAIKNEMRLNDHKHTDALKDYREEVSKEMERLQSVDEDRRQDVRELFKQVTENKIMVYEEKISRLQDENSMLKGQKKS